MFKKLLVAVITANICFSSLVYAQNPAAENIAEEAVAEYITSIDEDGTRSKTLSNPAVLVGGTAAALTFAYAVKKIIENPELGRYYVAVQNSSAYAKMMAIAEKKATATATKEAIIKVSDQEITLMHNYERTLAHKSAIEKANRANYWKAIGSMTKGDYTAANKYLAQWEKGKAMLAKPVTANTGRFVRVAAKVAVPLAIVSVVAYSIWGDEEEENVSINNNRSMLNREVNRIIKTDADALAIFIYNLNDEQRKVAYSVLAENPKIFTMVRTQIENALSYDNINAMIEYYDIVSRADNTLKRNIALEELRKGSAASLRNIIFRFNNRESYDLAINE